jgi:hypothetical protein
MKASLLISGHPLVYDPCHISLRDNVNIENLSIFAHTWWDDSYKNKCYKMHFRERFGNENLSESLANKFSVEKIKVEKSRSFDIGFLEKFDNRTWGDYDSNRNWIPMSLEYYRLMTPILLLSVLSQTYTAYQSYLLSKDGDFDVCIKSRNDILFTKPIKNIIESLDLSEDKIYFQSSVNGGHLYAGEFPDRPCDWFFVGNPKSVGKFLEKWHESIKNEYISGIIHTNEYVRRICSQNDLELILVDFGAVIYKQTNDYYQKYLNPIDVYMNDFDFEKSEPRNPEMWPYWISDVDFKHTQKLNF